MSPLIILALLTSNPAGLNGAPPSPSGPAASSADRSAANRVITLEQLRARALKHRPELALQEARVAGAKAGVGVAQAPQQPKIAGRVEATASPGSELVTVQEVGTNEEFVVAGSKALGDGIEAFEPQLRYSAQVGLDWNIWDFGRTDAATQAARAELRARQAEAALTRQSLITAVDEVYLEWLGAYERAKLESNTVERLAQRTRDLFARANAGGLAPSAVLPVRADLAAARLRESYADGAVSLAQLAVEEATGQPLPSGAAPDPRLLNYGAVRSSAAPATTTSTSSTPATQQTAATGVAGLLPNDFGDPLDPDEAQDKVLAARADAARAQLRLHDKRFMPQLRASGSAGLRGQFGTVFPFYAAGLGLEIPISDGGDGAARADSARADLRALELRRQQNAVERQRKMTRQQLQLTQARRRVELAEALLQAAEARLVDALERYDESAATPSEVGQAQAQRSQAAAQLLTAKLDRARAALAVAR